ncbi:DUF6417 family protein [Streptomyces sp. NPDC006622]|uniref:DUF6417 family protein n=1 Tax=Streptomyces sp. NPDC006622 TaxID=3155459 RepID=UPI00339F8389
MEYAEERLPLLTLEQAHTMLRVVRHVTLESVPVAAEAVRVVEGDRRTHPVAGLTARPAGPAGADRVSVA